LKVVNLTGSRYRICLAIDEDLGHSAECRNVNDSRMLELKVNDTVADSKNVTVDAGKNITVNFSYKPMDPGLCRLQRG